MIRFVPTVLVLLALILCGCKQDTKLAKRDPVPIDWKESSFLIDGQSEEAGHRLYSYILFGSRPNDVTRERYIECIKAYLALSSEFGSDLPRSELNITYLPTENKPPYSSSDERLPEWLLQNYSYAKSHGLLSKMPKMCRDGPYIFSYPKPISDIDKVSGHFLLIDLSNVAPRVVRPWVKEFFNQSSRERYWEPDRKRWVILKARNVIATLAEILETVPL